MKNFKLIYFYFILSFLIVFSVSSCKKNDEGQGAPVITRIRTVYQSTQTSQTITAFDSTTNDGKIGTLYAIIGNNLSTTQAIYINGVSIYFNIAYASNTALQFSVPNTVPFSSDSTSNHITVVNAHGKTSFPFVIEQPLPGITSVNQLAGNPGDIITIKGTIFNGLTSVTFGTLPARVVTKTPTVITAEVPVGFTYGAISVTTAATKGGGIGTGPVLTSGTSELSNSVTASHLSSAIFGFSTAVFEDSFENDWSDYGWGTSPTVSSQISRRGTSSISYAYTGGYDGFVIQPGNGNNVDANTAVKFSIYGGKGTTGKNIHLILNYNFNVSVQITLTEGQWTDYQIPITNWVDNNNPAPSSISALVFQEFSGNASQFNMDDVGIVELK